MAIAGDNVEATAGDVVTDTGGELGPNSLATGSGCNELGPGSVRTGTSAGNGLAPAPSGQVQAMSLVQARSSFLAEAFCQMQ